MTVPNIITQKRIADAIDLTKRAKEAKASLREDLLAGTPVEDGSHLARLIEVEKKSPNWKGFILRRHGKKVVNRILAATQPSTYRKMELR